MGVSDDTIRRWAADGRLRAGTDPAGVQMIDGVSLAELARTSAAGSQDEPVRRSARNQFAGIVTRVDVDSLMAVVEIHSGPHRLVSIMTAEAVEELNLRIGAPATALVKATQVIVETPRQD